MTPTKKNKNKIMRQLQNTEQAEESQNRHREAEQAEQAEVDMIAERHWGTYYSEKNKTSK